MARPSVDEVPPCGCAAPGTTDAASCFCSVEDLLRVIRRRYSLAVMNAIHHRGEAGARYHDLELALPEASTSTLAETLVVLETARLIAKNEDESGRPVYALTGSGSKLVRRLRPLLLEVREE